MKKLKEGAVVAVRDGGELESESDADSESEEEAPSTHSHEPS